jgi:hypothetical protein
LFSHGSHKYLVYVDRFSGFLIVHAWRTDPSTQQVVDVLVQHFGYFGTPLRIRTDGGPQFASAAFKEFLESWGVSTGYSTPHYPQSNGHAEAGVKAMKALVIKSECKGNLHDPAFVAGLLEWRNTPKEHGCSPTQLVFGRSLRSKVPAMPEALAAPVDSAGQEEKRRQLADRARAHYDVHALDVQPLCVGQRVRIQDSVSKLWDKAGVIIAAGRNRDYHVKIDSGRTYWRNRKFVRLDKVPATEAVQRRPPPPEPSGGKGRKRVHLPEPQASRRSRREKRCPDRLGVVPQA